VVVGRGEPTGEYAVLPNVDTPIIDSKVDCSQLVELVELLLCRGKCRELK
jgi:hypothetical protein